MHVLMFWLGSQQGMYDLKLALNLTLSSTSWTSGSLQLVLALAPILVNATTNANREMYVIKAIKSIQTIVTITSNAVITAIKTIMEITVSQSIDNCNYCHDH